MAVIPKSAPQLRPVLLRLDPSTHAKLALAAALHCESQAAVVRRVLRMGLERELTAAQPAVVNG